jgi:hypothetical protein
MRLARTRRPKWAWTFRDGGLRRLHSRNDTEHLLSSPENARRLFAALERSREIRNRMAFDSVEELRAALRLSEAEFPS